MNRSRRSIPTSGRTCRLIGSSMARCTVGENRAEEFKVEEFKRAYGSSGSHTNKRKLGTEGRGRPCEGSSRTNNFLARWLFPLGDLRAPAARCDEELHGPAGPGRAQDHAYGRVSLERNGLREVGGGV